MAGRFFLLSRVLDCKLPSDLTEQIVRIAASMQLQAATRGMIARRHLPPFSSHGFQRCGTDARGQWIFAANAPSSIDLCEQLTAWSNEWRPGIYELLLTITHDDGVTTTLGLERVSVNPSTTDWTPGDLSQTLRFYLHAFLGCHGPLRDATVSLRAL